MQVNNILKTTSGVQDIGLGVNMAKERVLKDILLVVYTHCHIKWCIALWVNRGLDQGTYV